MEPKEGHIFYRQGLEYNGDSYNGLSMISKDVGINKNFYFPLSPNHGMLSMIYIISDEKPREVSLRFNKSDMFVSQYRNIVKVDKYIPFNDKCFKTQQNPINLKETPFSDNSNVYKINMFEKNACMNCRKDETEAYFFPLDIITHNEPSIRIEFDNYLRNIYIIVEYIEPHYVREYIGMGKYGKIIYRISDGAIGIVPSNLYETTKICKEINYTI